MDFLEYLTSPQTIISVAIALGWIWAWYKVLEHRVEQNEKDIKEIKSWHLDVKVIEMQKDIQYIREKLDMFANLIKKE